MINDLNKKLNKDNIINESFNELQYDSQSINMIDNLNQNQTEKKSNIKCSKEYKIKKLKFVKYKINLDNKKYMKNSNKKIKINNITNKNINNLDKNKTKDIKIEIMKKNNSKNKKSYLLIKDLLRNKVIKSNFLSYNDNINKYNCYTQFIITKSQKIKNGFKNKANIFNSKTNKNKTKDYFNKGLESYSLKKSKTIKNQILSGNIKRGCIAKHDNINQLTYKNIFTNILDKSTKNFKSISFNNKDKDNLNNNREIFLYNIKNLVINTGKNNFIDKTIIKDNKYLKESILIKDKNNKDINKTSNLSDLNVNLKNKNSFNLYIKHNDIKNIFCKITKNKTKKKIEFINPIIHPSLIEDNKNYKYISLASVLNNDNKYKNISYNTNTYNNKNHKKYSKNAIIYNSIEERYKRTTIFGKRKILNWQFKLNNSANFNIECK